jgi:hypothetical protein
MVAASLAMTALGSRAGVTAVVRTCFVAHPLSTVARTARPASCHFLIFVLLLLLFELARPVVARPSWSDHTDRNAVQTQT